MTAIIFILQPPKSHLNLAFPSCQNGQDDGNYGTTKPSFQACNFFGFDPHDGPPTL